MNEGNNTTLVLYIPYINGAVLISDRLNTLYTGEQAPQNKIIKISKDTIIAFAGNTEVCLNIIEEIKLQNRDLSQNQINKIIMETFRTIRKESDDSVSVEFLIVQQIKKQIRIWKNTNGFGHSIENDSVHAIGMHRSILPHLRSSTRKLQYNIAKNYGIDLLGWVSIIESMVGDPAKFGCNICKMSLEEIIIENIFVEPNLNRMRYRLDDETKETENTQLNGTIRIGYISSTTAGLQTAVPLITEIIQADLNEYASKLGYNVDFEFLIDDARGQAAVHLEKVQGLNSMGVKYILGGGWSSQAQASLRYCNDNDILLMSSSSTSPLLGISGDNFFRTCPTDIVQTPAISRMIESWGTKAIVVIQRGDAWADGIYNYFEPLFTSSGGIILEKIRYAGEATEFSAYLERAEMIAKNAVDEFGVEKVGILVISFSEIVVMAVQAKDYPIIYNLPWFGSDGTVLSQQLCDDAPEQADHLKIFSTYAAPTESSKFTEIYDRYYALTSQPFGYYSACLYDAAWIIASAILHAQSYNPLQVIPLLHDIAHNTFGASGWCKLNENGDRYSSNYQIWSYRYEGNVVKPYVAGLFDGTSGQVTWHIDINTIKAKMYS